MNMQYDLVEVTEPVSVFQHGDVLFHQLVELMQFNPDIPAPDGDHEAAALSVRELHAYTDRYPDLQLSAAEQHELLRASVADKVGTTDVTGFLYARDELTRMLELSV